MKPSQPEFLPGFEEAQGYGPVNGACQVQLDALMKYWNSKPYLGQAVSMSDKRKASCLRRLQDDYFCKNFRIAIDRIAQSDFCRGFNDRGWMANFDWFIRPDTVLRIMEGFYDNRPVFKRKTPAEIQQEKKRLESELIGKTPEDMQQIYSKIKALG